MPEGLPRVVFMGTPELARVILAALASSPDWTLPLVVAQPDKQAGRGLATQAPPVKREALARGIPVLQPAKSRDPHFIAQLRDARPDVIVVAAFGQILPPDILSIPPHGCLNVHTSLLPRWRGAAPIQWAILEGDPLTGVTLMNMDAGLDTGPIVATATTPILPTDTSQELHDRLALLGANLLTETLPRWIRGTIPARPQPVAGVTYARKLTREDGDLDWALPAAALERRIRAFSPWPGAHTRCPEPGGSEFLLKVWSAVSLPETHGTKPGQVLHASGDSLVVAAGAGALQLKEVQREGRRRMGSRQFLAGCALKAGDQLGSPPKP